MSKGLRIVSAALALALTLGALSACSFGVNLTGLFGTDGGEPQSDGGSVLDAGKPVDSGSDSDAGSSAYRALILSAGPVAYWRMGTVSGPRIPDESGHANDLLLRGSGHGRAVPGAIMMDSDGAMRFNGKTSYASASDPRQLDFLGTAAFSLECWASADPPDPPDAATPEIYRSLINHSMGSGASRNGYLLYTSNSSPPRYAIQFDRNNATDSVGAPAPPPQGFDHIVVTFDGALTVFYRNGLESDRVTFASSTTALSAEFLIGSEQGGASNLFAGVLDEVAVYPRALPLAEVAIHYAQGANR
jgi:trimeric autotransporter adhesin